MKIDPNPCRGHGCYDPDLGCTIPASELQPDPGPEDFSMLEVAQDAQEPDL